MTKSAKANAGSDTHPLEAEQIPSTRGQNQQENLDTQHKNANVSNIDSARNDKDLQKVITETLERLTPIRPLEGQGEAYEALADDSNSAVMLLGDAGTGKTLLAVSDALRRLEEGSISFIILAANMVGVDGEEIGFLPGNETEKCEAELSGVLEAFDSLIGRGNRKALVAGRFIQLQPIRNILGRSIYNSVIIIDEGQQLSKHQMRATLTRASANTFVRIMGDLKQSDFKKKGPFDISGLEFVSRHMRDNPYMKMVKLRVGHRSHLCETVVHDFDKGESAELERVHAQFGPFMKFLRKSYRRFNWFRFYIKHF